MVHYTSALMMIIAALASVSAAPMDPAMAMPAMAMPMGMMDPAMAMPMGMMDPGAVTYAIKIFTDLNLTQMYSDMPYTIFAPSDMAFETFAKSLNATVVDLITKPMFKKAAISTLEYNIVPGVALLSSAITAKPTTVPTAAGPTTMLTVVAQDGKVLVSPGTTVTPATAAMVLKPDIKLGMSIVHVTNKVLVPPTA